MAALKPLPLLEAPGLHTVLCSDDFAAWDSLVAGTLGHHRSRLLPGSPPFRTHIRRAAAAEFEVLLLHGRGRLELLREQAGHGVLWLPLQGLTQEVINGVAVVAEPGMGVLFRPGDAMRGLTSDAITGLSILIPGSCLRGPGPGARLPPARPGARQPPAGRGRAGARPRRHLAAPGHRACRGRPGGSAAAMVPPPRGRTAA